MKYFLYKLIPPRPTFPQDMTEAEGKIMQEHVAYWQDLADRRITIIFGPILDPDGAYGIAIVEAKDEIVILEKVKTTLQSRRKLVLNRSIIQCLILFYVGRQVTFDNL
jgi:hypothetical protein